MKICNRCVHVEPIGSGLETAVCNYIGNKKYFTSLVTGKYIAPECRLIRSADEELPEGVARCGPCGDLYKSIKEQQ